LDANPATQLHLLDVTVTAQRAMLRARAPEQVVDALELAVTRLGGAVVPAHAGGADVLHLDIGLGVRPPIVPCAAADDPARQRLERVLPGLVEDANQVVQRLWRLAERGGDPTLLDDLTGALHVEATRRLIDRSRPGTALVGLAVDVDGAVAATHGPSRVDVLLRELAGYLNSELDVDERLGRLAGPGVVAVLPHPEPARPKELSTRSRARWERRPGAGEVTVTSADVVVDEDPTAALAELRRGLGLATDADHDHGGRP
jgi:GGDEF domain-containing protein